MFDSDNGKSLESAKRRALKILGSRQMSAEDMYKRLISKGETEEDAAETVSWLERMGAIDDVRYAESICLHYSGKGYGLTRIKDELFKRGIPRQLWDEALTAVEETEMDDAAVEFLHKKLRGSVEKDDIRRATDALCRRGYSYEDARMAVKRYIEDIE